MKVLQLCSKCPIPADDGGKIAMLEMAYGLQEAGMEVMQLVFDTFKHPVPQPLPANYPFVLKAVKLNTRVTVWGALKNLLSTKSYNLSRFESPSQLNALTGLLQEETIDIIQAESIFSIASLQSIREITSIPVILRAHNVEFRIWERLAGSTANPLKRWYLRIQADRLRTEEISICNAVDGIVAISETDKSELLLAGVTTPITVVAISTPLKPSSDISNGSTPVSLFHLGAMDWAPNVEGIDWFISEVWPGVHRAWPQLKLILAGKNMPVRFSGFGAIGIETRIAEDAAAFMEAHGIMVVPLLSGSGIRVKIVEGLALGKVIIATPVAVEGIPVENGVHLLIGGTSEELMKQIARCINDPDLTAQLSKNARIFAHEHFSRERLTRALIGFYHERSLP